jgi:hypothetical protein
VKVLKMHKLHKAELKILVKQEDGDNSLEINEYIEAGRIWRREGFDAALAHLRVLKES